MSVGSGGLFFSRQSTTLRRLLVHDCTPAGLVPTGLREAGVYLFYRERQLLKGSGYEERCTVGVRLCRFDCDSAANWPV